MRRAFVFGFPALHSLSPAIHNAAFRAAGLDVEYAAREMPPADLAAAVADLRSPNVLGTNVTVPHKVAVMELVDEVDEIARTVGAANTIHNRGGRLWATNTDVGGFARSLAAAEIPLDGVDVLLLGAGGSSRAVAYALLSGGVRRVLVANRTPERAARLAVEMRALFPRATVEASGLHDLSRGRVAGCSVVVNTTTVGMRERASPIDPILLPIDGAVVDIIYTPTRTTLLDRAEAAGLRTLNGLPMLVHQAALAWEIWTGRPAPLGVMFEAVDAVLARREAARARS
jgi:shikimate dehydrogenase